MPAAARAGRGRRQCSALDGAASRYIAAAYRAGPAHRRPLALLGDVVRGRAIARKALQHWVIRPSATLTRLLGEHRLPVDAGDSPVGLRRILDLSGTQDWVWAPLNRQTPLTRATCRIASLNRAVLLRQVSAAVARSTSPRRPAARGRRPLPLAAVRAWAHTSPDWITDQDTITPASPVPHPRERDLAVISAFTGGKPVLTWSRLRAALQEQGVTPLAVEAIVFW